MVKNKGVTLVEVIVALAIFWVVISVAVNIFAYELKGQRKSSAMQLVQNNSRYALESISKEIRMSHIEADSNENMLHITAYKIGGVAVDVVYILAGGKILRNGSAITSDQISVSKLKFYINNQANTPAIMTIVMTAETSGAKAEQNVKIDLQTTISTRNY
ncbi:PilW family protein [Patescibacteria group bacterium]